MLTTYTWAGGTRCSDGWPLALAALETLVAAAAQCGAPRAHERRRRRPPPGRGRPPHRGRGCAPGSPAACSSRSPCPVRSKRRKNNAKKATVCPRSLRGTGRA